MGKLLKKFGLRTKLICLFLISSLLPLIFISYSSMKKSSNALKEEAFERLKTMKKIKGNSIKDYFKFIDDQMITFSSNVMVVEAMRDFSKAFGSYSTELNLTPEGLNNYKRSLQNYYQSEFGSKFEKENGDDIDSLSLLGRLGKTELALQYNYISNNPNPLGSKENLDFSKDDTTYDKIHERYHPSIRKFLQKFGYYDIFLVDAETGHIVYSVFKELDYATSLLNGPYSKTNFGDAFRKAKAAGQNDKTFLVDYKKYTPSYDAPASFISSPIFDNGKKIGVAIFQMPIDRINAIMAEKAGTGKTGETYLVGSDGLMRSNSFFSEEHSVTNSFKNLKRINTEAFNIAKDGKGGQLITTNYNGKKVLSSASPIHILGLRWIEIAEIELNEAFQKLLAIEKWMKIALAIIGVLVLVIGTFATKVIYTSVSLPISKASEELEKCSNRIFESSSQVSNGSQELARSTNDQSAAIQQTVASMEEMTAMLEQTSHNAEKGLQISEDGQVNVQTGMKVIHKMVDAMEDIEISNNRLQDIVKAISEIKEKTEIINDIVSETRLLSFNASIEAARAGVHGKGFAVVAEEVGNLASMSGKAAEEIKKLLDSSTSEVTEIVKNTQEKVIQGKETSKNCEEAFFKMKDSLNSIAQSIEHINSASIEQKEGVKQTNLAMREMESVARQNLMNSEELSRNSPILKDGAEKLNFLVGDLREIVHGNSSQKNNSVNGSLRNDHDKEEFNVKPQEPIVHQNFKIKGTVSRDDSRWKKHA